MLKRTANYLQKGIFPASHVGLILGAVLLVAIVPLTVADVVLRRFFQSPIPGTVELTEFGLVLIVFLSLAFCAAQQGHVVVDVLVGRFPKRAQAIIDAIVYFCCVVLLALMSWQLLSYALRLRGMNQVSTILGLELYPFVLIVFLGSILFTLVFFIQFLNHLAEVRK